MTSPNWNFDNIPRELRQLIQWVVWEPTKAPFNPSSGKPASTTDPQTWCSFEEAVSGYHNGNGRYAGIGFVFSAHDDYCGIDLDYPYALRDDGTPKFPPEKQAEIVARHNSIVEAFDSYAEFSPSGKGVHIIIKAEISSGRRREAVEIYSRGRYFTMTGNVYRASPIAERQNLANTLCEQMGRSISTVEDTSQFYATATETDAAIFDMASTAKNGEKFLALWNGDGSVINSKDESAIDQALVNILQFYAKDPAQIERLWLASPHGQRRKTQTRRDYRDRTIRRAFDGELPPMDISGVVNSFKPPIQAISPQGLGPISARDLASMEFAPIKYVVPGIVAEGLSLLAGRPKLGKSWACLEIAIAVAGGGNCLGNLPCERGEVLYLALEDNRRRLKSRLHKLSNDGALEIPDGLFFETEWPRDPDGVSKIREWLSRYPGAKLVIVDVLAAFRGLKKPNQQQQYDADYGAIKGLQALASEFGVAIIVVHHTRKAKAEVDPVESVSGTLGLSGAADTIIILDRDTNGCTLYGRGRDIQEFEFAVQFDAETCRWQLLGNPREVRRSDERTKIIEFLKSSGGVKSPKEIAYVTNMPSDNVRKLLGSMVEAGEVVKTAPGSYRCVPVGNGFF
ncbi:AAA family ATPase [Mesorhizobium sp. B2-3-11]|uniref:AAA family ATPase n=1 Tax=Mesorhizobium sp. B2-3-11 TaxID=2589953 RepID=UPI0015E32095|nr:AAA family ATPase [Mesorhizobium sp. B2-3-11]